MMELFSNPNIQYILIFLIVVLVAIGIKKFNIKNDHKQEIELGLDMVDFLIKNSDIKVEDKEKVSIITKYVKEAMDFVQEYNKNEENKEEIKRLVKLETISICEENQIKVDDETIMLVDRLINYLIDVM